MAERYQPLKKADLGKRSNDENFVNKFFHQEGMMNEWRHEDGMFVPEALVIIQDGNEIQAYEPDEKEKISEALMYVKHMLSRGVNSDSLAFSGRFTKSGKISTQKFTKFFKTEEFGGKGAYKNLGNAFEEDMAESLDCKVNCLCKRTKYMKEAQVILDKIQDTTPQNLGVKGKDISLANVVWEGGKNQKRTLVESGNGAAIKTENALSENIGKIVTDITLYYGGIDSNPKYLSCKFGSTVTFINTGVQKIFPASEFKDANFTNSLAKNIISMFGMDPVKFALSFEGYPHSKPLGKETPNASKYDKSAIEKLLKYAIGYNYWMVHAGIPGGMKVYPVNQTFMNQAGTLTGGITIHYGGKSGKGKRVDITCESSKYTFNWNIRNKQSGKYPSHIMCDYKKKG
mgnify:CR=1 FL=1